ncbi:MAG: class I SAM-dependent methyltransferase [Candidatus Omnitrophica bacterium]|nr:class I SAM-dependent methyltransferase [Candidatus Omnitrophota bacterium]
MNLKHLFCRCLDEIRNTGERPIINTKFEDVEPVLQFAYKFASKKIAENSTVLDFGCGGGYGTEYLSRSKKNITVGYDCDAATIRNNRIFFKSACNLSFTDSYAQLKRYDVVVFFQVIEHLRKDNIECCLKQFKGLLNDGGTFLLATVNKNITSHKLKKPIMPFHIYEFTPGELSDLLKRFFSRVNCNGQIDADVLNNIRSAGWSYSKDFDSGIRTKFIRNISQIGIVRCAARHLPLFVKRFLLGERAPKMQQSNYELTTVPSEIDNSYILMYECQI